MNKWKLYYPRPQLKRDSFFSLDGEWFIDNLPIEVPFPKESPLSNYDGDKFSENFTYTKEFSLPQGFNKYGNRVILHFGAVDQIAEIFLNDELIIKHEGGYLPFEKDVTDYLRKKNIIKVKVKDELNDFYPYGKQTKKPSGMWYTPISGIWKSVWMESVSKNYIRNIKIKTLKTKLVLDIDSNDISFIIDITIDKKNHYKQYFETKHIEIPYNDFKAPIHYWNTNDPYLYEMSISTNTDKINSYFGIRQIEIIQTEKGPRLFLNDEPLIIQGVLDQGYFMSGIFTPEDPMDYFNDVLIMKELGFNTIRKHIKIEPDVFYYACDKLGMIVFQDSPNSGKYNFIKDTAIPTAGLKTFKDNIFINRNRYNFFIEHTKEMLDTLYNHPSILFYTIYNEGWGQQNSDDAYKQLKEYDETRLYDSTSGWFFNNDSDFLSHHIYFRNEVLRNNTNKPLILSECGGYKRSIEGHLYDSSKEYGYGKTDSKDELSQNYETMFSKMIMPSILNGLCGYIITQLSDVETEINGFYTYDRQVCKVDKKIIYNLNNNAKEFYQKNCL